MNQLPLLSAGKLNLVFNRSFASRLFSSRIFYSCCLLMTFLLTAGFTYYKKWWAVTYADTSTATFPTTPFLGRVITGDFDKDGDDDILYQAGVDGTPIMFAASNGNGTFAAAVAQNLSPFKNVPAFNLLTSTAHVADFDADGDTDVWFAAANATGTYFRNDNGLFSSQSSSSFPAPEFPGRPVHGDFDADGDPDFLYQTSADGSAFMYARNNGNGTFTISNQAASPFSAITLVDMTTLLTTVADYDHDGDQDIWVPVGNTTGSFYQNNGITFSNPASAGFPAPQFPGRVKVGDYDNDGDPDILYQTGLDGSAFGYYQNNGSGTFTNAGIAGSPFNGLTLPNLLGTNYNVVDFDNDGDIDIYATANSTQGTYFVQQAPANAAPTINAPGTITVSEDYVNALTGFSFSDADAGSGPVTVSLSVPSGSLAATAGSGVTVSGTATARSLDGTIADINAFIAAGNLRYITAANATANVTLTIGINDNGNTGAGGAKTASGTVTLVVAAVNDGPALNVPLTFNVTEDLATELTGISFSDIDAGSSSVTVMLLAPTGTLGATTGGGVSVSGSGTGVLTLGGSIANINTLFAAGGVMYTTAANANAGLTLSVTIFDNGNTGTGGNKSASGTISVSITAINDTPVITVPASINVTEDQATALTGISFSDVDAGSGIVSVTIGALSGIFNATSGSGVTVSAPGSGNIVLTGTISDVNAFIAASSVTYTPLRNISGNVTMTVWISDNGSTGAGGAKTATAPVILSIGAVNDAPVNTVPGPQQTDMNVDLAFNTGNGNLISISDVDIQNPAATILEIKLSVSQGTLRLGSIANLTFSTGSGTLDPTMTFRGTLNAINAALATLVYSPTTGLTGPVTLEILTSDLGNIGSGGTQTDTDNIPITINVTNPRITTVGSTTANGIYNTGEVIHITLRFDQQVVVTGTPQLLLETGTTNRPASYIGGSGSNTLTFRYIVQAGDEVADLDYASTTALSLNSGTIKNATNDDAILTLPTVGGANSLGAQHNIAIDGIAPEISSVTPPPVATYLAGQHLDLTVNYSENVVVNTTGGTPYLTIIVGGSARQAAYLSGTGTGALVFRYTAQPGDLVPTGIGIGATLTPNGGTLQDPAGNAASVLLQNLGNTFGVRIDAVVPTVAITTTASNPVNTSFSITITFSEAVTGFTVGDITGTNCTFSAFTVVSPQTYTAQVTPATNGAVPINIVAGIAHDLPGNPNTASNTLTLNYDGTRPAIVISSAAPNTVNTAFTATFTFSEDVNDFTSADINVGNATVSNITSPDQKTYTALITPASDGLVTVSVPANIATDLAGNANTASNTLNRSFDGAPPSVTISTTAVSPVNQPFTIQLVFSEAVTGLTLADLIIGNGTVANLQTTDNITYSAVITPITDGPVTVQLPAGSVIDIGVNANSASNQLTLSYDITAPTVTLSKTIGSATNAPFTVSIQFSEAVNGFVATDLALTNATAGNLQTTDNKNYTALITPVGEGNVTVTVPAGIATDQATNPNTMATAALNVLYDITMPTVAITTTAPDPVKGLFTITISFSEAVNGFQLSDLNVQNVTISNLQTSDNITFTATVQPATEGVASVSVKAGGASDPAGNTNTASATLSRHFDINAPVITVSARNVAHNIVTVPFTAVFSSAEKIQGLTLAEIAVTNGVASNLVKESDFIYSATITPVYGREEVTVQLPAGTVEDLAGNPNALSNKLSLMVFGSARIVKVYPVPTSGPLTILFDGILARKTRIIVMDFAGRIFYTRDYQMTSKQLQLNFTGLMPVGLYQLVVINDGLIDRRNIVIAP